MCCLRGSMFNNHYEWDAKVVISVAAFAVSYGEFWLVERIRAKNPLAEDIAAPKHLPEVMEHSRKKFEANGVDDLLKAVLTSTHTIVNFKEFSSSHLISWDSLEMAEAHSHIATTVYLIIRSILPCASILLNHVHNSRKYAAAEPWEICDLAGQLKLMQRQLQNCNEAIETMKIMNEFDSLKKLFGTTTHDNTMKTIKALIIAQSYERPLFHRTRNINATLDVLKSRSYLWWGWKYTLLLISDLDLPQQQLNILHLIYNQKLIRYDYEVLWLPIVDKAKLMSPSEESKFLELCNSMQWYSVDHPTLVNPVAIKYIREVWNFIHMPVLAVLDPTGTVLNHNAIPAMWTWGSPAFLFSKQNEKTLWKESTWNIKLLADNIDPRILDWIEKERIICLYGGEEIEWIREFTKLMKIVAKNINFPVEMLYVGKSNLKEKVRRCREIIDKEKLSHTFPTKNYHDYVWCFWVRLQNMWDSKPQLGTTVESDDPIMKGIRTMLIYDESEQGWAVFGWGTSKLTEAKGDVLIRVLKDYNRWKHRVDQHYKFLPTLAEEISRDRPEHHCNHLILRADGYTPERVICSDCGRIMEKRFVFVPRLPMA